VNINPDDQEADYALFGRVLLQWGHVEVQLVNILLRLLHPRFGFVAEKGLVSAFGDQVKLARRAYRSIPQMSHLRDKACDLFDTLRPLHKTRSIIIHGHYQGYLGKGQFAFGIFERQPGPRMVNKAYYFTEDQVAQLSSEIERRRKELGTLSADTFQVEFPEII
jgi:hypothetical protein